MRGRGQRGASPRPFFGYFSTFLVKKLAVWTHCIIFAEIMEKKKDSRYQRVGRIALQAAIVTLLAFLFSMLIMQPMSFSVMSIFSSPEKSDTSVTDLYAQVADRRPVRTLDPDVVLVDIDRADRAQIAEILDEINLWSPRVVGLDVIFAAPGEDDSELLRAISESDRIVLPIGLESVGFDKSDKSDESDESGISGKSKNPEKSSKAGISEVFRVSDAQFFYPPGVRLMILISKPEERRVTSSTRRSIFRAHSKGPLSASLPRPFSCPTAAVWIPFRSLWPRPTGRGRTLC